jgi:hypothetical protein
VPKAVARPNQENRQIGKFFLSAVSRANFPRRLRRSSRAKPSRKVLENRARNLFGPGTQPVMVRMLSGGLGAAQRPIETSDKKNLSANRKS